MKLKTLLKVTKDLFQIEFIKEHDDEPNVYDIVDTSLRCNYKDVPLYIREYDDNEVKYIHSEAENIDDSYMESSITIGVIVK